MVKVTASSSFSVTTNINIINVGGPGNDIAHYRDINKKFFGDGRYKVVEVDQRGTGKSTPSVQADYQNMEYYMDISISQMSEDFERLRTHLNIDKWLVFGMR